VCSLFGVGLVIAGLLWLGGIYATTPAASPTTPSEVTSSQRATEPEQRTTPPPTPSPNEHKTISLTGVAEGECEDGTNGVTCRIRSAVHADSDGRVQLQPSGSQYLLVTCTGSSCTASSVTKFELPCITLEANTVFCADAPQDRRGHYTRLISQVRGCEALNGVVECVPQPGTSVTGGQLSVGWLPAEAAIINGKVGIYAAAAPLMDTIQKVSDCYTIPDAGTIQCRTQGTGSSTPSKIACGVDERGIICGPFHPSRATEQSIAVFCPGGDANVICSLSQQERWFVNRLDCKAEVSGQPGWRLCTPARTN